MAKYRVKIRGIESEKEFAISFTTSTNEEAYSMATEDTIKHQGAWFILDKKRFFFWVIVCIGSLNVMDEGQSIQDILKHGGRLPFAKDLYECGGILKRNS